MNESENREVSIYLKGYDTEVPLRAFFVDILEGWIEVQWFESDVRNEYIPAHRVVSVIG